MYLEVGSMVIPGYRFGEPDVAKSPVSVADLKALMRAAGFEDSDRQALRRVADILEPYLDELLDVWYAFVGSVPELLRAFSDPAGKPIETYLEAVRQRFRQWVLDTCRREYDQTWLDYQHEIGLRHHRLKKNRTDGVNSTDHVPLRYLVALAAPISLTVRSFLARAERDPLELDRLHAAWTKAVIIQVALWAFPYANEGDW